MRDLSSASRKVCGIAVDVSSDARPAPGEFDDDRWIVIGLTFSAGI